MSETHQGDATAIPTAPERFGESYIGTKIIRAESMNYETWARSQGKWTEGQETLGDGYKVQYEDGYFSWSPKDVFERCYRLVTTQEKHLMW